jgi:hypothetical protein
MNENSLLAFRNIQKTLTLKQAKVLSIYQRGGEYTDQQVARALGWPINRVSGRVGELLHKLKKIEKVRDEFIDGSKCRVCRLVEEDKQMTLI